MRCRMRGTAGVIVGNELGGLVERSLRSGQDARGLFLGYRQHRSQDIVDETGATSFAIQPAQPYTSEDLDYNDPDSRVSKEHADPSLQDVALAQDTPDDWASYDTVLIGYPIWWGEAAYPVASFAKANDFTGKTVIPFCTSASSGLGQSAEHLSELANGGEWMGGMRFPSGVNGDEVRQWVDDLGLEKQNL